MTTRLVVLPVLYHLLWRQVLAADPNSAPLDRPLWGNGPGDLPGWWTTAPYRRCQHLNWRDRYVDV